MGDDEVSDELLAQPELTAHAVRVLSSMPVLGESARLRRPACPMRIVLRSPGLPDVALDAGDPPRFELIDGVADDDAIVTTDAANRLLVIWGRRSSNRPVSIEAEPALADAVTALLWPAAQTWPPTEPR